MRGIKESAIAFFKRGGHNHDGKNSTKVDFSHYEPGDVRILAELLRTNEATGAGTGGNGTEDAAATISATTSAGQLVAGKFVSTSVDPPKNVQTYTSVAFKGHERVYIDVEWEAPPVKDFQYDEYYFNYLYPHDYGESVDHYEVALQKEGELESDFRTTTRNTKIRFWDVDPNFEYRVYVWAVNSLNYQSLYETQTITSSDIRTVYTSEKNRTLIANGGFEDGLTEWVFNAGGGTFSIDTATWVYEGTNSLKWVGDNGETGTIYSQGVPVSEGLSYDFSYYAVVTDASGEIDSNLIWYDANDNDFATIDLGDYSSLLPAGPSATDFNRRPLSDNDTFIVAPAGAVYAVLEINFVSTFTTTSFYIDNIIFEEVSTLQGAALRTDAQDKTPHIAIQDHYNILAPRQRSYAPHHPRITFDEDYISAGKLNETEGNQEKLVISSGIPNVADSALYTNHDVGESQLVLLSSPAAPAGDIGQQRQELRYIENYTDGFQKSHSMPLGLVAYAQKDADETTIGGTERILITTGTGNETTYFADRIYRFTFNTGYFYFSDSNTPFNLRFQVDAVNRHQFRFMSISGHQGWGSWSGLWSPTADVVGVTRMTLQRVAGTGTCDMLNITTNTFFGVEDVGSQFIHDLN
jgi:hypothetical protein